MIHIANAKDLPPVDEWPANHVYVGRAVPRKGLKVSPLANPWSVPRSGNTETVLTYFRTWVNGREGYPSGDEIHRLRALYDEHGDLTLVCWCVTWDGTGEAPNRCHSEIIKAVLEDER